MKVYIRNILLVLGLLAWPRLAQAQFTFTTNGGAITITGYNGPLHAPYFVIPAVTNGYPVTAIGDYAFESQHFVTNVALPSSLASIGRYAFNDCRVLSSVSLPAAVTNLGQLVFSYCTNLASINVDAANPVFSSVDGVLFNKAQTSLIEYPGGLGGVYKIPGSVTNIGFGALSSSAFSGVNIPESVIWVDTSAFSDCLNLTNISVDGANPNYSSVNGVLFNKAQTELYQFPSGLGGAYTVPESVGYIWPTAFELSGVTSVMLPKKIGNMEYEAFAQCGGLTSMVIPAGVTNLGFDAFYSCTNLTAVYFLGNEPRVDGSDVYLSGTFSQSPTTVYYMPGTTGWSGSYDGALEVLWNPQASGVGFTGGQYGFNFTVPTNATIVVEASTNLNQPVWVPVATNTFSGGGAAVFSDSRSGNYPVRYYRMRSP